MAGSEKDGNLAGGGSSGGIPNELPLFPADLTSCFIFPTDFFMTIAYEARKGLYEVIERMVDVGYAIAIPVNAGNAMMGGVLSEIRNLTKSEEKKLLKIEIRPIKRVHVVSASPDPKTRDLYFGRWLPADEIGISSDRANEEDFLQKLDALRFSFEELSAILTVSADKKEAKYFQAASELIDELNADNLAKTLDAIMVAVNQVSWKGFDMVTPSFIVLKEENVEIRLDNVFQLLELLAHHLLDDYDMDVSGGLQNTEDGETYLDDTAEKREVKLLTAPENKTSLIQKNLEQPRKIENPPAVIRPPDATRGRLVALNYRKPNAFTKHVFDFLSQYVVGQERAKNHVAKVLFRIKLGRVNPRRPVIGGIFCGPTSVGKTELVKATAKFLFDDFHGYTHISCNLLKERHETAYLIGAPPGYIGHNDEPVLSQWRIDKPHFLKEVKELRGAEILALEKDIAELEEKYLKSSSENERNAIRGQITKKDKKLHQILGRAGYKPENKYSSMLLLDEVERAHPAFYESFLQVFDDGRLPLMNGDITDFTRTIFWMTSNIHGREIQADISGKYIGFSPLEGTESAKDRFSRQTWKEVISAVERHFSSNVAFLARVGKENLIVFYPLDHKELFEIIDRMYLRDFVLYLKDSVGVSEFYLTDEAKEFIVKETQDPLNRALGARALQKVFERLIENPVLNLLGRAEEGDGLKAGDRVWVDVRKTNEEPNGEIVVFKEEN